MASPEEIMNKPWPHQEPTVRLDHMTDLPPEEIERLRSENRFLLEDNGNRQQQAYAEKSAACPIFSMALTAPTPTCTNGKLAVNLEARYDRSPDGQHRSIVARMDWHALVGSYHQLFTDARCDQASRVKSGRTFCTLRRGRDSSGRFLPLPDVVVDETWMTLSPGDRVARDFVLDLTRNDGWREELREGGEYWLQFGGGTAWIREWRFGTLEEWEGEYWSPNERYTWVPITPWPVERCALPCRVDDKRLMLAKTMWSGDGSE